MKIQILSDLHNEFCRGRRQPVRDIKDVGADLVVLAGDIDVGVEGVKWAIGQSERLGRPVVYVCGNHEFYRECPKELLASIRQISSGTRVHVLENDSFEFGGVRFLGATLWTDFHGLGVRREAECISAAGSNIIDFRLIRCHREDGTDVALRPTDTASWHAKSVSWLTEQLSKPFAGVTVVVTHHGPSIGCHNYGLHGGPDAVSTAFWSHLEGIIHPDQVALWIYGHTHSNLRFEVNGVRVECNQHGYLEDARECPGFDFGYVVDVLE